MVFAKVLEAANSGTMVCAKVLGTMVFAMVLEAANSGFRLFDAPEFEPHDICDGFDTPDFESHDICDGFDIPEFESHDIAMVSTSRNSSPMIFARFSRPDFSPRKLQASAAYYICTTEVDFPASPAHYVFTIKKSTFQPRSERSDTHDPRRGCAGTLQNTQKRTAEALRHTRSPQRVYVYV